mmetsp:Transcript_9145/g.10289  ORF Transcript_9145/g.10289 Transcript_9145/m.10289 type:complete len:195 (+) Transcript_9145:118-702(+)
MYQFERIRSQNKMSLLYYHPLFQKGRPDLMLKIKRLPVGVKKSERETENSDISRQESFETQKRVKICEKLDQTVSYVAPNDREDTEDQQSEFHWNLIMNTENTYEEMPLNSSSPVINSNETFIPAEEPEEIERNESVFRSNFLILRQIASNSRGYIEGSNLPDGFQEFQSVLEKMLGFDEIDNLIIETPIPNFN